MRLILFVIFISFIGFSLTSKNFLQEDDLKTYLNKFERKDLDSIAYACERFEREKLKTGKLLGGLVDYLWRLTKENVIGVINDYCVKYPELKENNYFEKLAGLSSNTSFQDYLNSKEKDDLVKMAIAAEKYSRKKQGKEAIIGGIHDYVSFLEKKDIIPIILNFVEEYPELSKNRFLDQLVSGKTKETTYDDVFKSFNSYKKHDLIYFAISLDEYDRERKPRLGGVRDFAYRLNNDELKKVITNYLMQYPELLEENQLNTLVNRIKVENAGLFGGLIDYLKDFNIIEVRKLALAGEKYDREQKKIILLGGLHDYIDTLSLENIRKIIHSYIMTYNELNENGKLEELAGVKRNALISDYRENDNESLIKLCLAIEKYIREKTGSHSKGGIHDYVHRLSSDELIEYINTSTEKFPELGTKEMYDKLLKEF